MKSRQLVQEIVQQAPSPYTQDVAVSGMVAHLKKEILSGKSGYWDLPLDIYAHERMGDLDFYGMAEDGNWEAQYDAATEAVLAGLKPLERKHERNRQRY